MTLKNKKILLGVSGGIAAYKSLSLVRLLKKQGAEVRVVMTESAQRDFIAPGSFQALTGHPVATDTTQNDNGMEHIDLARWADLLLIAPATANTIAAMANGLANNLLQTLYLACDAPVAIAPAMNQQMFSHKATTRNLATLVSDGVRIFGPAYGDQACGEHGPGRMMEAENLCDSVVHTLLHLKQDLKNTRIMITGGPTFEDIDPVRFIGNRSSGKMAFALAQAAHSRGAKVHLISGPVNLSPGMINTTFIRSAQDMHDTVMANISQQDIFIGAAAVGDFRSEHVNQHKIKKQDDLLQLNLTQNPDIIHDVASLSDNKSQKLFVVGFAAETTNLAAYAQNKLKKKNIDMIAANLVGEKDSGFESDINTLEIFVKNNKGQSLKTIGPHNKQELAHKLLDAILHTRTN